MPSFTTRATGWLAFAVPLGLGVLGASPEPYWLDSPEFTAAAMTLGLPHPPGHPLYVMLAKFFTLLPVGGIALRVALASATFAALAAWLVWRIGTVLIASAAPRLPETVRSIVAFAAALLVAVAPGVWFQAVRAEVYSLQLLLVLAFLYFVICHCLGEGAESGQNLYLAAFCGGLGLANHHFIMLVSATAVLPVLVAEARYRGGLGAVAFAGKLTAVGALGLLPYAFLPLRSLTGTPIALGGVHSVADFFWVVSAKVYQKSMAHNQDLLLPNRSLDIFYSVMSQLGPVVTIVALGGIYLLLRQGRTRLAGAALATGLVVTVLLRAVMGLDPFNPDYYGYLMPAVAILGLCLAVFVGVTLDVVRFALPKGPLLAAVLAALCLAVPLLRGRDARAEVDLSRFIATRLFVDAGFADAAPGTRLLTTSYRLFFVLWSARYIDGSRPDVMTINPHFFAYPGYLRATMARLPETELLVRSMLTSGEINEPALAELARLGPLKTEPWPEMGDAVVRYLLPDGPLYPTSPEPLTRSDVAAAAPAHVATWDRLYRLLGDGWKEPETQHILLWSHFQDALYFARRGNRASAAKAVDRALALGSESDELLALVAKLTEPGTGPIDIAPFLPGAKAKPPAPKASRLR